MIDFIVINRGMSMGVGIRLNKDGKPTWGSRLKYWFGRNQEYKDFYKSMYGNSSTESISLFSRFNSIIKFFGEFGLFLHQHRVSH